MLLVQALLIYILFLVAHKNNNNNNNNNNFFFFKKKVMEHLKFKSWTYLIHPLGRSGMSEVFSGSLDQGIGFPRYKRRQQNSLLIIAIIHNQENLVIHDWLYLSR